MKKSLRIDLQMAVESIELCSRKIIVFFLLILYSNLHLSNFEQLKTFWKYPRGSVASLTCLK